MFTKNESGRSMIEMLGVLAIVGVLSVGGISGYSKAMAKQKLNRTSYQISQILTSVRSFYTNQGSFKGLTNASAIDYELVPPEMIKEISAADGGTSKIIRNPYGGVVNLSTNNDENLFILEFGGLDYLSCVEIASSDWGATASTGLVSISVGKGGKADDIKITKIFDWSSKGLPISLQTARTTCTDGENALRWEYDWLAY